MNEEKYIIKTEPLHDGKSLRGLGWYCFENMLLHENKISQICAETGQSDTYGQMLKRSIRTAIKLIEKSIVSTDIISLCTYNHLNSTIPLIASQFLCCKVASFDPLLSQNDTNYLMKQIKPRLIFVTPEAVRLIENAIESAGCKTEIVVFGNSIKYQNFDEYLKESLFEDYFKPKIPNSIKDTAIIYFSSGTTGYPKGICCSHLGNILQSQRLIYSKVITDTVLGFASPYWISNIIIFLSTLSIGKTRIITPKFLPESFWTITSKYKISMVLITPSQMFDILTVKPESIDTSTINYICIGGSSITGEQIRFLRRQFPYTGIVQAYGQTELCGAITFIDPLVDEDILDKKAASCGIPMHGICFKIVDVDTGDILGPNKVGELLIKSDYTMNGYYGIDSSDCWDKDGYIRTGDMLYYDEDKYFYHVDRIKEMLKYKSWHVQPNVIENVILQHPAVLKAVVVGIPHPHDGDHPMALIIIKKGYENVTEDEVTIFANERLDDRQQLRGGLRIIKNLPLTPTGKIQRMQIRNLILNNAL